MLRLLFVTNTLAYGGAERHAITLMNRLSERGNGCHAAYIKNERAQLNRIKLPQSSQVRCLHAKRYLDPSAIRRLAELIGEVQPMAIIAANEYSLLYATAARIRARTSAPLVVTYHSTRLLGIKEQLKMLLYRILFWRAQCAVFVCDRQRRFWRRRGVFARKNVVIFNGVDVKAFHPEPRAGPPAVSRTALGLRKSDFVIGIAAGLRPEKNHVQLVDAVKRLRAAGVPARALLIGDGAMRDAINRRALQHGIADHIIITGYQDDVRPFIRLCDVATLCSLTETFSLAAIEAMALGKPFVHSDVGGAAEMIDPGRNGYLFSSDNTTEYVTSLRALAHRDRCRKMGRNARQVAECRFSEQHMIDCYEHLLRDLCGLSRDAMRLSADSG